MTNEISSQQTSSKKKIKLWIIVGFLVIITIAIISCIVYFWQEVKIIKLEKDYQQQIRNIRAQQNQQLQESANNGLLNSDDQSKQTTPTELDRIIVDWEKELIKIEENCEGKNQCFLAGKITNDNLIYKGKFFYLEVISDMGSTIRYYTVEKGSDGTDKKVYLDGYQGSEKAITIVGISDVPNEIIFPGTEYSLEKYSVPSYLFSGMDIERKIFTNEKIGDFYLTKDGCIIAELPDHTAIAYDLVLPFINAKNRIIDMVLNGGGKNQDEYDYIRASCGGVCSHLSETNVANMKLEVAGVIANGESIYRLNDPEDNLLKDLYNNKNTIAYYGSGYEQQGKNKYSYDEFVRSNPYLFWQDPLGRWIQFKNSKFAVAAEMCKPVIYLYPQSEINLNLKINLNGGLTYTDPLYKNGWKVSATPDGRIKNLENGERYDYLLWEGVGTNYPEQDKGWVVQKKHLSLFLDEKLKILGLNKKEIGDFKEYWLARLNEKPFYKISFLAREQFDSLASIDFYPIKPNVFIRILMTAQGVDDYINIPEQNLPANTPRRYGFTAVEWGGALLK